MYNKNQVHLLVMTS